MDVTNERCCGMDVHKKTVVACIITPESQLTRTFSTMTSGLLEMADWLNNESLMWPWRARVCTGSQCTTCLKTISR